MLHSEVFVIFRITPLQRERRTAYHRVSDRGSEKSYHRQFRFGVTACVQPNNQETRLDSRLSGFLDWNTGQTFG